MRRAVPTNAVGLGVVGIPADWERYRNAFFALSPRLRIKAIHDPVLVRSQLAAADLEAEAVSGLKALFQRDDIEGVVLFGGHWYGSVPLQLACEHQKPCLLAGRRVEVNADLRGLARRAATEGTLLMVELPWRHQPVTSRLREVLLTSLGPPVDIDIRASVSSTATPAEWRAQLAELVDWCGFVCAASVVSVVPADTVESAGQGERYHVRLQPPRSSEPVTARICLARSDAVGGRCEVDVRCHRGRATISPDMQLTWSCAGADVAGPVARESLESERGPVEVLLDRFCRRVVGGLVPVETLSDLVRLWDQIAAGGA